MELKRALKDLFHSTDFCLDVVTGMTQPSRDGNPFHTCAEHLRTVAAFGKEHTSALAVQLGWIPNWGKAQKGDAELALFFDLKVLWLELYGIAWEFRTMPQYWPRGEESSKLFDFLAETHYWVRSRMRAL